jgi:hypothetical protein
MPPLRTPKDVSEGSSDAGSERSEALKLNIFKITPQITPKCDDNNPLQFILSSLMKELYKNSKED